MDPSFILDMNNEGVRLLDDQDYKGAAKLFRDAFRALENHIVCGGDVVVGEQQVTTHNNNNITSEKAVVLLDNHDEELDGTSSVPSGDATDTRSSKMLQEGENSNRRKRQLCQGLQMTAEECDQVKSSPQKRRRISSFATEEDDSSSSSSSRSCKATPKKESEPLGRPLWIEQTNNNKNNNNNNNKVILNMYASSIMYNYGYALHRIGARMPDGEKKFRFQFETMKVYGKAILLAARSRALVVQWIACHNLQQLIPDRASFLNEPKDKVAEKVQILEVRKTSILRSMSSRANASPDQTCLMLLSMLGIGGSERPDRPAAAA